VRPLNPRKERERREKREERRENRAESREQREERGREGERETLTNNIVVRFRLGPPSVGGGHQRQFDCCFLKTRTGSSSRHTRRDSWRRSCGRRARRCRSTWRSQFSAKRQSTSRSLATTVPRSSPAVLRLLCATGASSAGRPTSRRTATKKAVAAAAAERRRDRTIGKPLSDLP